MSIDLSVVIPAYNEEKRLGATLRRVLDYLAAERVRYEVLVVDDGSVDGTAGVVQGLASEGVELVRQPQNRGKGAAVRRGVLASRGEWVLVTDADLSTPIEDLERLRARAEDADLILGSRAVADSEITRRQPIPRELMGKTFNLIIRRLGLTALKDTQCGFKLMRGEAARQVLSEARVDGFAYDVELVALAHRQGLRVAEVGVTWHDSPASKVHPLRDSARMLWDVLKIARRT